MIMFVCFCSGKHEVMCDTLGKKNEGTSFEFVARQTVTICKQFHVVTFCCFYIINLMIGQRLQRLAER